MDMRVVGRERGEERAILEELSGPPKTVRAGDRRWMLAIAGIAAIACMGFAGDFIAPTSTEMARPSPDNVAPAPDAPNEQPGVRANGIQVDVSRGHTTVGGGLVPVRIHATPNHRVHISVTVGAAVVGWRDVKLGADGSWTGWVEVFASRVALPAVVHAVVVDGSTRAEAFAATTLGGGSQVVIWDASIMSGEDGRPIVAYDAAAPLSFGDVDAWVANAAGHRLGASRREILVDFARPGSAGGRELGIGSVADAIKLRPGAVGTLVLHLAWRDASTGARGSLERTVDVRSSDTPD
jgi:hypothetical protein